MSNGPQNPSHLKVKRLVELPQLPPGASGEAWMYAVRPGNTNQDHKVFLPDLIEEAVEIVSDEIIQEAGEYTDQEVDQVRQDLLSTSDSLGTDMVAYKLDDASSVARGLRDKLGDTISVKDFGAVGDGVAEDTAAIQAAIAYAKSLGGAVVIFPPGLYSTRRLWIDGDNITLQGSGRGATTLRSIEGHSVIRMGMLTGSLSSWTEIKNITVRDMTIDGNKNADAGYPTGLEEPALSAYTVDTMLLEGLEVKDGSGYGVGLVGSNLPNRRNWTIRDCEIYGSRYDCIDIKVGPENITIDNVIVRDNGGGLDPGRDKPGLDVRGSNVTIRKVTAIRCGMDGIRIRVNAGSPVLVEDCYTYDNVQDGISIGQDSTNISYILRNCYSYDNTRFGYRFNGGDVLFDGCYAKNNGSSGLAVLGDSNTSSLVEVRGGVYRDNGLDGIQIAATGLLYPSRITGALTLGNTRYGCNIASATIINGVASLNNGSVGILINNSVSSYTITGSLSTDTRSTGKTQTYGLQTASGAGVGYVVGNQFVGNLTANFTGTLAAGTVFLSNADTQSIRLGSVTALGAETLSGTMQIRDSGGTLRKVAIVS